MELIEKLDEGVLKWGALALSIVALEYIGDESLTHACQRALDTRIGRVAVPVAMGVTVAHLMDWIPHAYDPYYILTQGIDWVKDKIG